MPKFEVSKLGKRGGLRSTRVVEARTEREAARTAIKKINGDKQAGEIVVQKVTKPQIRRLIR